MMMMVLIRLFVFALCVSVATVVTAAGTTQDGLDYLAKNAEKDGVVSLESGLQYRVLKKGTGLYHPAPSTPCLCHYKGTLIDGTQFDSSYDRGQPTTFAPNQVIKGWTEAMQLMVEGDKWEMTIPSELAYGDTGSPPTIPGGAVLVFEMELLEIQATSDDDKVLAIKCDAKTKENCNEKEVKYIDKWSSKDKSTDDAKKELKRLNGMKSDKMKPELKAWLERRVKILEQISVEEEKDL